MPIFDPDHFERLYSVTECQVADDFDAAVDPISYARDWLAGYTFRLEEADRYRHFVDATEEGCEEMLAWADDPIRDRRIEAFAILRHRAKARPNAPYSPRLLLLEYEWIFQIPVSDRLRDGFPNRLSAWIDRVESFLCTDDSSQTFK